MPTITSTPANAPAADIYYEDNGSGRPIVLIHGWPLSGRSWEAQVPVLVEAGYRVVTYDRRGFGNSSQTWDGYDYATFTADLAAVLDHLDLRDAVLAGFSMGGGEVVRYLSTYGTDRVSAAVLIGAVPPYMYISDDHPAGVMDDAGIASMQGNVRADRAAFLDGFLTFFYSVDGDLKVSEEFRQYAKSIALAASPKGTSDCIAAFGRTDFRADVDKVTVPTLVIHSDSDPIVPFEKTGKRSHAAIAGSELVVVEGAPHGFITSHADEVNKALLAFVEKLGK